MVRGIWLSVRAILLVKMSKRVRVDSKVQTVVNIVGEVLGVKAAKYANMTNIPPM